MKQKIIFAAVALVLIVVALLLWPWYRLHDRIALPYLGHQKPFIDPHLPIADPLSDKLDEVLFDGLFNISATPSGIVYEDALGELVSIDDQSFVVTVRLKPGVRWHTSYNVNLDDDDVVLTEAQSVLFSARDLAFTLRRIEQLGSLSPDYILVAQALERMEFSGPDADNLIRFQFRKDRLWTNNDVKEVLSFKIVQEKSPMTPANILVGTGPYLSVSGPAGLDGFQRNPVGLANVSRILLKPFVDNSTYPTELNNGNINVILSTPFGSLSPVLSDTTKFFNKSNIPTTFFAILMNTSRLNREQRAALRQLLGTAPIMQRFFRIGSPQQRHIVDYRGGQNLYEDLINRSVFPSSSYYVEEKIVTPLAPSGGDPAVLPDTVRIKTSIDYGYREELVELIDILNDKAVGKGRIRATAAGKDEIKAGNYDAVLVAFSGYRSTFLFDLYDVFLREPDPEFYRIALKTTETNGERFVSPASFSPSGNFCRMDASDGVESGDFRKLLDHIYGFMATREIGDKQAYAKFVDETERDLALGVWLFSLPSLSTFRTQFDARSIDLYGVAAQLSTIEKWKEMKDQ